MLRAGDLDMRFAAPGRARDKDDAVRFVDNLSNLFFLFLLETQRLEIDAQRVPVQDTEYNALPEQCR